MPSHQEAGHAAHLAEAVAEHPGDGDEAGGVDVEHDAVHGSTSC